MKFLHQLLLKPPKVRVTQEEILADLRYPAPAPKPARKAG
jgi:hypothetical protein